MSAPDGLRGFFSGRNALTWEEVDRAAAASDWAADARAWVRLLEHDDPDLAVVLPCLDPGGAAAWYGAARSSRGALQLAEALQAFVGPAYSDFDGRPHEPDPADPVEAALAACFARPLFRFRPWRPEDVGSIRRMLGLYRRQLERRPPSVRLAPRPAGVIRARFDRALLAGDESAARRLAEELAATGRLDPVNQLFLEVRLRAGLGFWPQIADDRRLLRALAERDLPARVVGDVTEALYRVLAEPLEPAADAAGALARFRDAGLAGLAGLFSTRHDIRRPRVLKAFALHELLRPDARPERLASLLDGLGEGRDGAFVAALRGLVPPPADEARRPAAGPVDVLAEADAAFDDNDYDRALDLYLRVPLTPRLCRRLLTCAAMDGSARTARWALAAMEAAGIDPASLGDAARNTAARVIALTTEATPSAPVRTEGWLPWARWLAGGGALDEATAALRAHAPGWTLEGLPAAEVEELATALFDAAQAAPRILEDAMPLLFEDAVLAPDRPIPAFRPLYSTLGMLLMLSGPRSPDDLELLRQLVDCQVAVGMDAASYLQLVADLEQVLGEDRSVATLAWALDVAEALALHRAPDQAARLRFQVAVLGLAEAVAHRLDPALARAVRLLSRDAGLPMPEAVREAAAQEAAPGSPLARLAGRHVAIYTLAEAAGRRAGELLREMAPGVRVTLRGDLVCTDQLAAAARSADVFVFAWRSSSHQAYYCIRDHRPKHLPLLQPLGKGSASIIQALQEA